MKYLRLEPTDCNICLTCGLDFFSDSQFEKQCPPCQGNKMKFGTKVNVKGRGTGTVVYNGLDGVGIAWGEYSFTDADERKAIDNFNAGFGGNKNGIPHPEIPMCEAMLRDSYEGADVECVGVDYEIL